MQDEDDEMPPTKEDEVLICEQMQQLIDGSGLADFPRILPGAAQDSGKVFQRLAMSRFDWCLQHSVLLHGRE